MMAAPSVESNLKLQPVIGVALQSVGLLSALIFLISSIYEVLVINTIYESQYFLIALLLAGLSLWAFVEVMAIRKQRSLPQLRNLQMILTVQLAVIVLRHWRDFQLHAGPAERLIPSDRGPEFYPAILFLLIYLLLFLAINRCLILAFADGERLRANQLHDQMQLLRRTEADLQASEERYRLIAHQVNDVIWTIDVEGRIGFISPSLQTLIGSSADAWIGQPLTNLLTPSSATLLEEALRQGLERGIRERRDLAPLRAELEHRHRDGSTIWTEITMNPLRAPAGELVGFVGVTRDIRSRKRRERLLQEARDAAEQANEALLSANATLKDRVTTDMLTGVSNRSHFEDMILSEMRTSRAQGEALSLLIIDVDNFKMVNDSHGHSRGDQILVEVARLLARSQRQLDHLARWGGDEFIMMLPSTSGGDALQVAHRLCHDVAVHHFSCAEKVSLSIGVAELRHLEDRTQWFDRADAALYEAKHSGRNTARLSDG